MEFNVKIYHVFNIFGQDVWLTETITSLWIVMAVMICLAVIIRIKLNFNTDSPGGLQNIAELVVEAFDGFVRNSVGNRLAYLGNWYFTVFFLIMFCNYSGIFLRASTADWAFTFPIAFVSFVLIVFMAFKHRPGEYMKGLLEPVFIFFPLNIIGELSRPVSLSFRLFGNVLSGMILVGLLYSLLPIPPFFIAIPLHAFFDLAIGTLQAYIFTVLSLSFIGVAAGTAND